VSRVEIVIEIVGELLSGIFEWICDSERVPRAVRAFIVSAVFLPIAGLFIAVAVTNIANIAVAVLCSAVVLLVTFAEIKIMRKIKPWQMLQEMEVITHKKKKKLQKN
jgi:hypothetical protein